MCCIIADAVLTGGIRRAALISLFDRDDQKMLTCKGKLPVAIKSITRNPEMEGTTYEVIWEGDVKEIFVSDYDAQGKIDIENEQVEWFNLAPYRGRANNSATLPRGEVGYDEFMALMETVEASGSGEPGIYWSSNLDWGTNPCCEIGLRPFQFCF